MSVKTTDGTVHVANGTQFDGLGLDAYRLALYSTLFLTEESTKTTEKMVEHNYKFSIKKATKNREEAAALFANLADRLAAAINNKEKSLLEKLSKAKTKGDAAFLKCLLAVIA